MTATRISIACALLGLVILCSTRSLADQTAEANHARFQAAKAPRAIIYLWMSGGASHIDTFDMKPEAPLEIRGTFKPIPTSVPGLEISEHLPRLARLMDQVALIRSLSHRESSHGDADYLMQTGRPPRGFVAYPSILSALARELGHEHSLLPYFVCLGGPPGAGGGYLESQYAPLLVDDGMLRQAAKSWSETNCVAVKTELRMTELVRQLCDQHLPTRLHARAELEEQGLRVLSVLRRAQAGKPSLEMHQRIDFLIDRLKAEQFSQALNLGQEPLALREAYGRGSFGQGCLLARRLVERGVPAVQVNMGGWDTHMENFKQVQRRSADLDAGLATLLSDLKERGLLDTTLIVWATEFGRSPRITAQTGRDHWPQAFTVALAGAGIKGGSVVGKTDRQGANVAERPVTVPELMATICAALGVDPTRRQLADRGVLIPLVDDNSSPVKEILRERRDQ